MLCNSISWNEIAEHYRASRQLKPMSDMVSAITDSQYASLLYGFIFLDDLIVSKNAVFELYSDCVHICFDVSAELFEAIDYRQTKKMWQRKFTILQINSGIDEILVRAKLDG